MGYKEEILENGNFRRTYFCFDNTKFYELYHNGKPMIFPINSMQLGDKQRINMMFDFSLVIAWILMDSFIIPALITFVNYIFI